MLLGQQEIRRRFFNKIKRAYNLAHKQGTMNRARMLEHRIQHLTRVSNMLEHHIQHHA